MVPLIPTSPDGATITVAAGSRASDADRDRRVGAVTRPRLPALREFLERETVAGAVLLVAAVAALIWANSAAGDSYVQFWHRELTIGLVHEDLLHWVNDGLMAIFFFVVGLEIKRELVTGELRDPRAATLPVLAAFGGVILPAVLFLVIAPSGPAARGWGVPMATDIAFAVGVLAIVGSRAGPAAKLLLLSIAIVDDIIAIVVIAAYYSDSVRWGWFGLALAGLAVIVAIGRFLTSPWFYLLPALVVWYAVLESGIHATLAGVVLGLLTPARPVGGRAVNEELEHLLHPVSAYLVIPVFALANAGIDLRGGALGQAVGARLTWAVVVGLVVGKTLGIAGGAFFARRRKVGVLPPGLAASGVWPVAAIGGIGFTVAMFIADLAFAAPLLITDAKIGIFIGSLVAAGLGLILVRLIGARTDSQVRA